MDPFETLLRAHMGAVQRFVKYKIASAFDADDVLQEVYLSASNAFDRLSDPAMFKPWLLGIARNKVADYYRQKARCLEIPLETVSEHILTHGIHGAAEQTYVHETISALADKDKQILYDYFFRNLPQAEIARKLQIPIGTVKSRLHTAKQHFRDRYPCPPKEKGANNMKNLPTFLPEYTITKLDAQPFPIRHEELPGMFIIPRVGQSCTFGMYDYPDMELTNYTQLKVTGKVNIHSVEGVEIQRTDVELGQKEKMTLFAQLTEDHCRYLGGISTRDGVQHLTTFLDEAFESNYAIGENNAGFSVYRQPEGRITERDGKLFCQGSGDLSDICGRYQVSIGGKTYDTVRLLDIQEFKGSMLCEYYLDANGRTVLWRRFNSDNWYREKYQRPWSELLPGSERLILNGQTFIHWYNCITDYIV